jgi:hypothetical protein
VRLLTYSYSFDVVSRLQSPVSMFLLIATYPCDSLLSSKLFNSSCRNLLNGREQLPGWQNRAAYCVADRKRITVVRSCEFCSHVADFTYASMWEVRNSLSISAIFGSPVLVALCVVRLRFLPVSAPFPGLCWAPAFWCPKRLLWGWYWCEIC